MGKRPQFTLGEKSSVGEHSRFLLEKKGRFLLFFFEKKIEGQEENKRKE